MSRVTTTSDARPTRGTELTGRVVGSHTDPRGRTIYHIALDGERDGEAVYIDGVRYPAMIMRNEKRIDFSREGP